MNLRAMQHRAASTLDVTAQTLSRRVPFPLPPSVRHRNRSGASNARLQHRDGEDTTMAGRETVSLQPDPTAPPPRYRALSPEALSQIQASRDT